MITNKLGKTVVITGAAATGKTTLCRRLLTHFLVNPKPVHMTRKLRDGEIENVDAVFLTEEEFMLKFEQGVYIQDSLDSTYFSGAYYGCPLDWIESTDNGDYTCVVSPTILVARKIKERLGKKVVWIHLSADKDTLIERLRERSPHMRAEDVEARMSRAVAKIDVTGSDILIDTSHLKAWEIFFQAMVRINLCAE
jgi:guanylate kinase